jgi:glycosyltransferase involved in cell wall biosynthesis
MSTVEPAPPRVTVVALCYNHERFVETCLDSIRAQTYQDFELIICDDASSDRSPDLIEAWIAKNFPNAIFLRQSLNLGVCKVLNLALAKACGQFLSMISTDDMWEQDKLARQVAFLDQQGDDVAMIYSDVSLMDVDGIVLPGRFIDRHWPGLTPPSGNLLEHLSTRNFIPAMATLIRTRSLRAVGGYDEKLAYEDYDMWLRLAQRFRIMFLDVIVARYRLVPGSLGDQLFRVPNRLSIVADCRIAIKQLRTPGHSPAMRASWATRLLDASYILYDMSDREAAPFLLQAAVFNRRPRWALLAIAARIGISRAAVRRAVELLPRK